MTDARRFAPASARNRDPILAVLARHVREGERVLEIASGSGEHAVFLAARLPVASFQPSDPDPAARASIDAWRRHTIAEAGASPVLPAIDLDVTSERARAAAPRVDVVVCINMIHIAPYSACEGLLELAARALEPGGLLYLYGPYKRGGAHTSEGNAAFDASLRGRDPSWGVRDLEQVLASAEARGFSLVEIVSMPTNNTSVVLRRS